MNTAHTRTQVGLMSKTELVNALAKRGYKSDGTTHYRKQAAWLIGPNGKRGYYNFRDLLIELLAVETVTCNTPVAHEVA